MLDFEEKLNFSTSWSLEKLNIQQSYLRKKPIKSYCLRDPLAPLSHPPKRRAISIIQLN